MVFRKILIANRGEIACRVMRTAKRIAEVRVSPEGREGIASFLEKRKAAWCSPKS